MKIDRLMTLTRFVWKKNILLSSFNPSKFSSKCFLFHGLLSRVDLGRAWGFWTEHERMWINQKWLTLQYQNDLHTKFETLSLYLSRWFECHIFNLCNLFFTEAEKGQSKIFWKSEKIFKIDNFETNRFWKVCQIEKTISNPGLVHRSTNNFHENRKYFAIQESSLNPENFRKSRKNSLSRDTCAKPRKASARKSCRQFTLIPTWNSNTVACS